MVREIVKEANLLYVAGSWVLPFLFVAAFVVFGVSALSLPLLILLALLSLFSFAQSVECEFTGGGLVMRSVLTGRELLRMEWGQFSSARAFERKAWWGGEERFVLLEGKRELRIDFGSTQEFERAVKFIDENTQLEAVYE